METEIDIPIQKPIQKPIPIQNNYKTLTYLNFSYRKLDVLPFCVIECENLKILDCSNNNLTQIDNLPLQLIYLNCSFNQIKKMDNLPSGIEKIICCNNKISILEYLPFSVNHLDCSNNNILLLDNLPLNLIYLSCNNNNISSLNNLPVKIKCLYCSGNQITHLFLPKSIESLSCDEDKITKITNINELKMNKLLFNNENELDTKYYIFTNKKIYHLF